MPRILPPRVFGTPTAKAAAILRSREEFSTALRNNDQKTLLGLDDNDRFGSMMGWASLFPGIPVNQFSDYADYLVAGTKKVWCSARAVDIKANTFLSTEMKVESKDEKKRKAGTEIKVDPELARLLQNPNPYDTRAEMDYLWVAHMSFTGNVFYLKDEMDGRGRPKYLYPLNPRFMSIIPDKKTKVASYLYRVNGEETHFAPEEIIHFKRPHANHPLLGLGEIESAESLYDEFINRALYNVRFMANGAHPSSVMVLDKDDIDQPDWDKVKARFNQEYGGTKNSGKTAFMNGKWSLLQLGITAQEMQELERSKTNIEHIFLNHGVPLSVAGFSSAANYATARQDDINFRKYTVLPLVNLYADGMNKEHGLIQAFHPDARLGFSLAGLVDVEQVMKDYGPAFDRGCLSPNDLLELIGKQRVSDPFMEQRFLLSGYVPIEMAGVIEPTVVDNTGKPTGNQKPPKDDSRSRAAA